MQNSFGPDFFQNIFLAHPESWELIASVESQAQCLQIQTWNYHWSPAITHIEATIIKHFTKYHKVAKTYTFTQTILIFCQIVFINIF